MGVFAVSFRECFRFFLTANHPDERRHSIFFVTEYVFNGIFLIRTANDLEVEGTYQTKRREVGGGVPKHKNRANSGIHLDEFASPPAVHKVGTFC